MTTPDIDILGHLDRIARRERSKLISQLLRYFGPQNIQLAEDVAQDALLAAMSTWPYKGVPDNPVAWLSRVARNRAIDRLRRENKEQTYDVAEDKRVSEAEILLLDAEDIADPELGTIFLCCHPKMDRMDQIAMTLRVVGGFTAREIASVFLIEDNTVAQRLSRARNVLKTLSVDSLVEFSPDELTKRLDAVLKVIYLIFSLGYSPSIGDKLVRQDVVLEAVRLCRELTLHPLTDGPETRALAALVHFQASRLNAREGEDGHPILFRDQDRSRWDRALISQALGFLRSSSVGDVVSRYHLEAGIASMYVVAADWSDIDWKQVLKHYDILKSITDSPVVAINACVALALSGSPQQALVDLQKISEEPRVKNYAPFHIAFAEILRLLDRSEEARASYGAAISSGVSGPVLQHLERRLASANVVSITEAS